MTRCDDDAIRLFGHLTVVTSPVFSASVLDGICSRDVPSCEGLCG